MTDPTVAVSAYVVFVFSVTLHEAAHAYVAMQGGDLTAYHGGQVSLSPLPHMRREPIGMLLLPVISVLYSGIPFGYASAPYDPAWADRHPRRAAWMALAGPAANALLVLFAALSLRVGLGRGVFEAPSSVFYSQIAVGHDAGIASAGAVLLSVLFSMNLGLLLLNLIPLPPLDGASAIGLLLPDDTARRYRDAVIGSGLGLLGLFVAWRLLDAIMDPVFLWLVNWVHVGIRYG